jgi:hypothetical protein
MVQAVKKRMSQTDIVVTALFFLAVVLSIVFILAMSRSSGITVQIQSRYGSAGAVADQRTQNILDNPPVQQQENGLPFWFLSMVVIACIAAVVVYLIARARHES